MTTKNFYVYVIKNMLNGKAYVGKSVNPKARWGDHKKIALGGKEQYPNDFFAIHAAMAKYGCENFIIKVIDEFEDELIAYQFETWWIDRLQTNNKKYGYNCNRGGLGGIQPSEETRQKLKMFQNRPEILKANSLRAKEYHKKNPGYLAKHNIGNQYTKGLKLSDEHKEKISQSSNGHKKSLETRLRMSMAQSGNRHSQAKLTEKQVREIKSKYIPHKHGCVKLGREYNVSPETIRRIVVGTGWMGVI